MLSGTFTVSRTNPLLVIITDGHSFHAGGSVIRDAASSVLPIMFSAGRSSLTSREFVIYEK